MLNDCCKELKGVKLEGLLAARDAAKLARESGACVEPIVKDILSEVKKVTSTGKRELTYRKYRFCAYVWPDEEKDAVEVLRALGYNCQRNEEYNHVSDVFLRLKW